MYTTYVVKYVKIRLVVYVFCFSLVYVAACKCPAGVFTF